MALVKSPGGSIFPYFYKNGELHCLKYGSFYEDGEPLLRLALVGMSHRDKRRWERLLREQETGLTFPAGYYSDPEMAKTWLIGE
ncbi:hypothetical protein D3C75_933250 [compost metagenome]